MWGTDMRRPSRIRRWFKWLGLTVCVLLLMMWVFSIWGNIRWLGSGSKADLCIGFRRQHIFVLWNGPGLLSGLNKTGWKVGWRNAFDAIPLMPHLMHSYKLWFFVLPFWIPLLLVAIPTTFLFWLDRHRIPQDHCQKCGYNLTGNTSGICPECGEKI